MSRHDTQLKFRVSDTLKRDLEVSAAANKRTLNAEITFLLEGALSGSGATNIGGAIQKMHTSLAGLTNALRVNGIEVSAPTVHPVVEPKN